MAFRIGLWLVGLICICLAAYYVWVGFWLHRFVEATSETLVMYKHSCDGLLEKQKISVEDHRYTITILSELEKDITTTSILEVWTRFTELNENFVRANYISSVLMTSLTAFETPLALTEEERSFISGEFSRRKTLGLEEISKISDRLDSGCKLKECLSGN